MDISSMKSMLELQALQTITSDLSNDTNNSTSSSAFSTIIDELLADATDSTTETLANQLGSVQTLMLQNNLSTASSDISTNPNTYVASFLLNGTALDPTATSTSSIADYSNSDYTGTTAYENVLAGANQYADFIAKASKTYNVPEKLIASVMKQESNFNAGAKSGAGASGLMQLMPSTAQFLGVKDTTDAEQSIMGGTKYLRQMLDQFGGDVKTALAAYNAGPGNIKKYHGIPPFKETQNYVKNIMSYYNA